MDVREIYPNDEIMIEKFEYAKYSGNADLKLSSWALVLPKDMREEIIIPDDGSVEIRP